MRGSSPIRRRAMRAGFSFSGSSLIGSIALAALLALGAGCGDDDGPMPTTDGGNLLPDGGLAPVDVPNPVLVQTMAPEEVRAGEVIMVSCLILDESGELYSSAGRTPTYRVSPETSIERMDGSLIAARAGEVEISCAFSDLMLTDESPAVVRILPGDPAEVVTSVDRSSVEAGGTVTASCDVFDAFGNRIEDAEPSVSVEPMDEGNTSDGLTTTFTRAGTYDVSCELAGAASVPERVEVTPSLPATLALAKVPDQPVYAIGQVVEVVAAVTDVYDNPIPDADVAFVSEPPGSMLGRNRFRYDADGTYVVTATVAPPTEGDVPLTGSVEIVVNGNGPSIQCTSPADGAMVDVAPGGTVTFSGEVSDTSGTDVVVVNGEVATLSADGTFSVPVTARFGMNFVDITAIDSFGAESSQTCTFLASDVWADPDDVLGNTVSLKLRQDAIDDGDRSGGIDSLGDLLQTVLDSDGLASTLDSALSDSNPLKADSCDVGGPFGSCTVRSRVDYQRLDLSGSKSVELRLVDGGLSARVAFDRLRVRLRVRGRVIGIPFDTEGWVTFDDPRVSMIFDITLSGGRPRITVRPGTVDVSIGGVDTSFSGLDGAVVNIVADLAEGTLRSTVENLLRDYIRDNFNDILDGVVAGLDISSLGTSLDVPSLGGGDPIPISFGVGFSSVSTTPSRFLVGIGTRFRGPTAIGTPSLGVAIPPGASPSFLDDPALSQSMGVSIHSVLFNQVTHAVWRGGLLNGTVTGDALGGSLPEGLTADLNGRLPPVAEMISGPEGDFVQIGIGALDLALVYPGLFEEPIRVTLGARATTNVALMGNDLSFEDITIEELSFSTGDVSLDASTREVLERFLRTLVQSIVDNVLNDALPALPVPSFALPDSLSTFGVPRGTELGIRSPSLANEPQHFVLRGDFGTL